VLVASDGIWDVFSNEEIVQFVKDNKKESRKSLCSKIMDIAVARESNDDMSVMIIFLKEKPFSDKLLLEPADPIISLKHAVHMLRGSSPPGPSLHPGPVIVEVAPSPDIKPKKIRSRTKKPSASSPAIGHSAKKVRNYAINDFLFSPSYCRNSFT